MALLSRNTSTQFYTNHFLSVSVSGSVNTPIKARYRGGCGKEIQWKSSPLLPWTLHRRPNINKQILILVFQYVQQRLLEADPDFPRRGRQLSRGAPTYHFAKFSQKLHEIERIWTGGVGRASKILLCRSATA